MLTAPITASAAGATAIVAGATGCKYRVIGFLLSFGGTVNAKWQSGSTDLTGEIYGVAGAQAVSPALPQANHATGPASQFTTNPGDDLVLNLSGNVAVGGYVVYERISASQ